MKHNKRPYPENLYAEVFKTGQNEVVILPADVDKTLEYALSTLTEREKDIILRIYEKNEMPRSIALWYGLSDVRIREIQHHALWKLGRPRQKLRLGITAFQERVECEANFLTIGDIDISVSTYGNLARAYGRDITLVNLCEKPPRELMRTRNFGPTKCKELVDELKRFGFDYIKLHDKEFDEASAKFFGIPFTKTEEVTQ